MVQHKGDQPSPPAAGAAATLYFAHLGRLLHGWMVSALQQLPEQTPLGVIVVAHRALDAYLSAQYRVANGIWEDAPEGERRLLVPPAPWSLRVWAREGRDARAPLSAPFNGGGNGSISDSAGAWLRDMLTGAVAHQRFRIDVLDAHFGLRLADEFEYKRRGPDAGDVYAVARDAAGNARVYTFARLRQWPPERLCRSPFAPPGPDVAVFCFDGVMFLDLALVVREMEESLAAPGEHAEAPALACLALTRLREAAAAGALSGNFYRALYLREAVPRADTPFLPAPARGGGDGGAAAAAATLEALLRRCVESTAMGVMDLKLQALVARPAAGAALVVPTRPRMRVSPADAAAHDRYLAALPAAARAAVYAYTDTESGRMNMTLQRHFALDPAGPLPADIRLLQQVLLGAPPLTADTVVYKVARYIFIPGGAAGIRSNYTMRPGSREVQRVFNSTTLDNHFNFGPFLDDMAACCAFEIVLPRGSRGPLIVGRHSAYPTEHEVILPYGCTLYIRDSRYSYVTYYGQAPSAAAQVLYAEMRTYRAVYEEPAGADGAGRDGLCGVCYVDVSSLAAHRGRSRGASSGRRCLDLVLADPRLAQFLAWLYAQQLCGCGVSVAGW